MVNKSCAALVALVLCACGSSDDGSGPDDGPGPDVGGDKKFGSIHTAFSGGGWRSHTAQAAWTLGMMNAGGLSLDEVFENAGSMSSNSGGTWFLTQLAYSERFREALEAPGAESTYASTGYLGLIKKAVSGKLGGCSSSPLKSWCEKWELLSAAVSLSGGLGSLNWGVVVNDVVFSPYGMNSELADTPISGAREAWASDKTLIFAAAPGCQRHVRQSPSGN